MSDYGNQQIIDKLLAHLERTGDEPVCELAGALLRGEIDWRTGVSASFYAEELGPQVDGFASWYQTLDDSERMQEARKFERQAEELERAEESPEPS